MVKTVLFIHMGLHKTATSSIQSILYHPKNRFFFRKNNINVLKLNWHENFLKNISKNKINIMSREGIILPNFSQIFLSDKYEMPPTEKNYKFNTIEQFNAKIKNLKDKLDFDFEVHIICALREQASYIESYYLQQIKVNAIKDDFESFKKNINFDIFFYSKFIEKLEKYYKVHCLWYETLLDNIKDDNNFRHFFKIIGLDNKFHNLPVKKCIKNIHINKSSIKPRDSPDVTSIPSVGKPRWMWGYLDRRMARVQSKSSKSVDDVRETNETPQISYYKNLFEKNEYETIYNKFYKDNLKLNIPVNIIEKYRNYLHNGP